MSAKIEADVELLKKQLLELSTSMLTAVNALSERMAYLETGENNAVVEGDDVVVKAAPNGKAQVKKTHR